MIDYHEAATWLFLAGGLLAGAGLGLVVFGGLWLTVRRLPAVRHPGRWLLMSLVARFAVALAGFLWLVRSGGPVAGLAGALGFVLARRAIIRRLPWRGATEEPEA